MPVELEYENIIKAAHQCHRYKVYGADADIFANALSFQKLDTNSDSQKFIEDGFRMGVLITSLKVALSVILKDGKIATEEADFHRLDKIKDGLKIGLPIGDIKAVVYEISSIFSRNKILPPENS